MGIYVNGVSAKPSVNADSVMYAYVGNDLVFSNIIPVAKPTILADLTFYADDYGRPASQSVGFSGFDSAAMTKSGDLSKTNAGEYTAVISLKDGYCWNDKSTAPISLVWHINKREIAVPELAVQPPWRQKVYWPQGEPYWSVSPEYRYCTEFPSTTMNIGENTTTISLKWPNDTCWYGTGGDTDDLEYTWDQVVSADDVKLDIIKTPTRDGGRYQWYGWQVNPLRGLYAERNGMTWNIDDYIEGKTTNENSNAPTADAWCRVSTDGYYIDETSFRYNYSTIAVFEKYAIRSDQQNRSTFIGSVYYGFYHQRDLRQGIPVYPTLSYDRVQSDGVIDLTGNSVTMHSTADLPDNNWWYFHPYDIDGKIRYDYVVGIKKGVTVLGDSVFERQCNEMYRTPCTGGWLENVEYVGREGYVETFNLSDYPSDGAQGGKYYRLARKQMTVVPNS